MEQIEIDKFKFGEDELAIIRKSGSIVKYQKGQTVFSEGDAADRVYLIEEGFVKIYRITADGRKVTVGSMRSPGQLMGLAETLFEAERTCFAGAINDTILVVIRKARFIELIENHPAIGIKIAATLSIRMREAEAIIHEMVCFQVSGRLAMLLIKMAKRAGVETDSGTKICLRLTHEEIAYMIGTSRQTVTSLLNSFKHENSISIEGKEVYILDIDKLNKWVM